MSQFPERLSSRTSASPDALRAARQRASAELDPVAALAQDARGAIGDLQNVLADLLARTGSSGGAAGGGDELDALVDGLGRLASQLGGERMNETCADIRTQTRDIVRSGLEFQMVAKLTAITVASLPSRSPELETYAEAFGDITQRLSAVSLDVEAQLGRIVTARGGAVEDFAGAFADLRRLRDGRNAEREIARNGGGRDAASALASAASALQGAARTETTKLFDAATAAGAFGDRADHVATALQMAQTAPAPKARAIRAVALALADDLVAGQRAMTDVLAKSAARLSDAGAAVASVFETWRDDPAAETRAAEAADPLTDVGPRIDAIARRTAEIEEMGAEARKSLTDLVNISRAIMVSAVNAGLIASRISSSGGPLTVLAAAAQSQALQCSRRIEDCSAAVTVLIGTMESLGLDAIRHDLDAVTDAAARRGASGAGAGAGGLAPRVSAIVGAFGRIAADVDRRRADVEAALAGFDAAVAPLRAERTGPLDVDASALADLRAILTTAAERDVHDRTVGASAKSAEAQAAEEFESAFF